MKHKPVTKNGESEELPSSYVYNLRTTVGHHFESHMIPAEFYVSSDALVHLKVSTEYLSKNCRTCRTVRWMPSLVLRPTESLGTRPVDALPSNQKM